MLNRRILRSKAMQSLYAYYKSEEANYNLALDFINETFSPDLNSMEPGDKSELSLKKKECRKIFLYNFKHDSFSMLKDSEQDTELTASEAFQGYNNHNKEDYHHFKNTMIQEVDRIYNLYLWMLNLPAEFAYIADNSRKEKETDTPNHFVQNKIVKLLRDDPIFNNELKNRKISWTVFHTEAHNWYKNILKKSSDFQNYLEEPKEKWQDFDSDRKLILLLYKSLLYKNESFQVFMESEDLNWEENKHVLKSMVLKTFKNVTSDDSNLQLSVLSNNWEDDKTFFEKLFQITVQKGKEFDNLIAEKSKNWDIERIAILDKIILKMAIAEMIHFPSIPIKVTINEYIELSKKFSTPKSKKFINGILDVLSEELKEQGIIKKSGRGLIDNK